MNDWHFHHSMAFIGFGLRKEIYTRKPKKAFDKARKLYKDEALNRLSKYDSIDIEDLKKRVRKKLKNDNRKNLVTKLLAFVLLLIILFATAILMRQIFNFTLVRRKYADKSEIFKTVIYKQENGRDVKVDYFKKGPKAAETFLKNGLKHQQSESYYETGERFRSASYYYDSVISEVYFFKNGDTIKNFPLIKDNGVHHITLHNNTNLETLEFDFYEGKIIGGTYLKHPR